MKRYEPIIREYGETGYQYTADMHESERGEYVKRVDAQAETDEALASRRLWKTAAENIQRELDLMRVRAEATAVWVARERVYYEVAGVISEGPLIVTPGGTCDEKLTLFWTDIVNDGFNLPYRMGPEIRVEFTYLPGISQQIILDGIYAEQYSYAPGCQYEDLGLMNQITVPESSLSATLLVGVLGLGVFFRSR